MDSHLIREEMQYAMEKFVLRFRDFVMCSLLASPTLLFVIYFSRFRTAIKAGHKG
jgi:hypothetical protein